MGSSRAKRQSVYTKGLTGDKTQQKNHPLHLFVDLRTEEKLWRLPIPQSASHGTEKVRKVKNNELPEPNCEGTQESKTYY